MVLASVCVCDRNFENHRRRYGGSSWWFTSLRRQGERRVAGVFVSICVEGEMCKSLIWMRSSYGDW
ncbi:hypothetical protein Hanom_Chr08g00731041 [Helianthus anomalus]